MMVRITVKISYLPLTHQGLHNYQSWHHKNNILKQRLTKCFLLRAFLEPKLKSPSYLLHCKCEFPFGILPSSSVKMKKLRDLENPCKNYVWEAPRDPRMGFLGNDFFFLKTEQFKTHSQETRKDNVCKT